MDDKSIIALYTKGDFSNLEEKHLIALMELARVDQERKIERERPTVRTIWISWDAKNAGGVPYISADRPKCKTLFTHKRYEMQNDKYARLNAEICRYLDIDPGESQQFEIRRVK